MSLRRSKRLNKGEKPTHLSIYELSVSPMSDNRNSQSEENSPIDDLNATIRFPNEVQKQTTEERENTVNMDDISTVLAQLLEKINELTVSNAETSKKVEELQQQLNNNSAQTQPPEQIPNNLPQNEDLDNSNSCNSGSSYRQSRKLIALPKFSGNPSEWPMFHSSFNTTTSSEGYTDWQNLKRLQDALSEDARAEVEALLINPSNVSYIIQTLQDAFGQPEQLVKAQLELVRQIPAIPENKIELIVPFATKIKNMRGYLESCGSGRHLDNAILLEEIVLKLPVNKRVEWSSHALTIKPYATIREFSDWISTLANCIRHMPVNIKDDKKKRSPVFVVGSSSKETYEIQPTEVLNCEEPRVLFRVLPVILKGPTGEFKSYALFDEASSVTLLNKSMAKQLGVTGPSRQLELEWLHDKKAIVSSMLVDVKISGTFENAHTFDIKNVNVVEDLELPKQTLKISELHSQYRHLKKLPISSYDDATPTILIGLKDSSLGVTRSIPFYSSHGPIAVKTKLGWMVYGPIGQTEPTFCKERVLFTLKNGKKENEALSELNCIVKNYIESEEFGIKSVPLLVPVNDARAKSLLKSTTQRNGDRFESGLLWKSDDVTLPNNLPMAINRFKSIERKMAKDHVYADKYKKVIRDYLDKGYAEKIADRTPVGSRTWYLPHFGA